MSLEKIRWLNVVGVILHILISIWQIHFGLRQLQLYVFLATKTQKIKN